MRAAFDWRTGLAERPGRAPAFYGAITAAVVVGALLNVSPLDPIKALIFMSSITSPYLEGRARLSKEKLASFDAFLENARKLVRSGKGNDMVCFNYFQATGGGHCEPGGRGSTMSAGDCAWP